MRASHKIALGGGFVVCLGMIGWVWAQGPAPPAAPAAAPVTLWNWLGIPQGCHKIEDALINPLGKHPKLERKPALKKIADPANLDSPNPAIKAAAKAKADADLAPQKIKAIRYLATVCCGCAKNKDDVKEALLTALDDCTEDVRYEAALALCGCSGNVCTTCNSGSCCDAKIMNKLQKVSEGQDAQGCWLEPSARVRAAAANALNACRRIRGPEAAPEKPKPLGEVPGEAPAKEKSPSKTGDQMLEETAASSAAGARVRAWPVGYTGPGESVAADSSPMAGAGSGTAAPEDLTTQLAHQWRLRDRLCPPGRWRERYAPVEEAAPPTPVTPEEKVPGAKPPTEAPPPEFEAPSPTGLARGTAMGGVPNMIGDLFGGGMAEFQISEIGGPVEVSVPVAGGDPGFKVADDNNPIPTDRFFCNYNLFTNSLHAADGVPRDFNRFVFGLEKTFFDGQSSVEFRIPFGNGLNATQDLMPGSPLMATEFGNIPVVLKTLLWRCEHQAFSVGLAAVTPTGRDGRVAILGQDILVVENEAWHFQPFFGWLWAPEGRRLFLELFGELDVAANGNDVLVPSFVAPGLERIGRYNDQTLGLLDLKIGYWLYQNPDARWVKGIVPTCEFHYTTTLQNTDNVEGVRNPFNRMDIVDMTAGVHILLGEKAVLTIAGAAPLTTQGNRVFDAEAVVQFNRRY